MRRLNECRNWVAYKDRMASAGRNKNHPSQIKTRDNTLKSN